jgi:hypothetical protein
LLESGERRIARPDDHRLLDQLLYRYAIVIPLIIVSDRDDRGPYGYYQEDDHGCCHRSMDGLDSHRLSTSLELPSLVEGSSVKF